MSEGTDFHRTGIAREEQHAGWSLFGCARTGHATYTPGEPGQRDRLMATTAGGTAWRHLRCGAFVTGGPDGSGPAAAPPLLRRGKERRGELLLRSCALTAACTPSRLGQHGPPHVPSPVPGRVPGGHAHHDRRLLVVNDGQLFSRRVTV